MGAALSEFFAYAATDLMRVSGPVVVSLLTLAGGVTLLAPPAGHLIAAIKASRRR